MSDICDRGADREAELRADAIADVLRALPHGPAHAFCRVCGEPIAAARQAALPGVETCVECQAELERALR